MKNTEISAFIAVLAVILVVEPQIFVYKHKLLKGRLVFKKIANFTHKLLQNFK